MVQKYTQKSNFWLELQTSCVNYRQTSGRIQSVVKNGIITMESLTSMTGYLAAFGAAFLWGSYLIPLKQHPKAGPFYFQWLNSLGILFSTVAVVVFAGPGVFSWWGVLTGFLWTAGSICSLIAVGREGLARASSRWMGIAILTSFFWGWLGFSETFNSLTLALTGLSLLLISLIGMAMLSDAAEPNPHELDVGQTAQNSLKPVLKKKKQFPFSLITGFLFGSYLVPLRFSGIDNMDFFPTVGISIFVFGLILKMASKPATHQPIRVKGIIAGGLWNAANLSSFYAVKALGLTIGYPLTQSAIFISLLWGILAFGELPARKSRIRLVLYSLLLFSGAICLSLA